MPYITSKTNRVEIRLTPELHTHARALCRAYGMSMTDLIRSLIVQAVQEGKIIPSSTMEALDEAER